MRSNLLDAVLAARADVAGQQPRRRSLDLVWARLSAFERAQLEREVDALAGRGVRAVWRGNAPLFHTGVLEALRRRVLAVIGPREARAELVVLAERAAAVAVDAGATVLAGDTDGPEAAAIAVAARRGGSTVAVLSEGFRRSGAPSPIDATVAVTACAPGRPWSVDTAMGRNDVIAGLATAVVAVGAASTGATLDAGMRALAAGRPVLAVGSTSGSRLLVDYGATAAIDDIELSWWLQNRLVEAPAVVSGAIAGATADDLAAPSGRHAVSGRQAASGRHAASATAPPVGARVERPTRHQRVEVAAWRPGARRWSTA